jgi:hypothetical protein
VVKKAGLTLAILAFCLLGTPLPAQIASASPGEVAWTKVNIPTEGANGNWALAIGSDINCFDIAPDGAIFAGANSAGSGFLNPPMAALAGRKRGRLTVLRPSSAPAAVPALSMSATAPLSTNQATAAQVSANCHPPADPPLTLMRQSLVSSLATAPVAMPLFISARQIQMAVISDIFMSWRRPTHRLPGLI